MLIFDSHCHSWRDWPYGLESPSRHAGSGARLLAQLDANAVGRALIVSARIGGGRGGDGWPNDDDDEYVGLLAAANPQRLQTVVDLDSWWSPTYHQPGAQQRLVAAVTRTAAVGFTHYLDDGRNDGWLRTTEADTVFDAAGELNLMASIPIIGDVWIADLAAVVERHPSVPVLLHHLGLPRADRLDADVAALAGLARLPNLGVKVSGPYYSSPVDEAFPYPTAASTLRRLYDAFGPTRLYWGSDWPVVESRMTYAQSLEAFGTSAGFMATDERDRVLGVNLAELLG